MRDQSQAVTRVLRSVLVCAVLVGMPIGVHADGLANEYLLTQRWRELFMVRSPVANPAFMLENRYITARGAFAPTMQGAFRLWELGGTMPIGLHQVAGFTWLGESADEVEGLKDPTTDPSDWATAETEASKNTKSLFMLSYAINPWRRLGVGANLSLAYESGFGDPVWGLGLDLGATYRVLRHPMLGEHLVGISTLNLLAPAMGEYPYPTLSSEGAYSMGLKCSWYGRFWEGRLESGLDLDLRDLLADDGEFVDAKEIEWGLSWRFGGWVLRIARAYLQLGFNEDGLDYWGFAAGVDVPTVNRGRSLSMLYQYNLKGEGDQASTHTLYAYAELGSHRADRYAQAMSQLLNLSPSTLYNRARKLYSEGKYWDAFFVFGQLKVQYPDFFRRDWVEYYMASCHEELDMRQSAEDRYRNALNEFPNSTATPHTRLGLMRVYYRNAELDAVGGQYRALNTASTPDSIRNHAHYLMGEALLYSGRYDEALEKLEQVPYSHPEYLFAKHSAALAYFKKGEDRRALLTLEEVILARPHNEAQEEIINRSFALLGFYFYEENAMGKAVTALRKVPKDSYYYQDALLGLAWSALKSQQWADCIEMGKELRQTTSLQVLKGEGVIVESYAYIRQNKFLEAAALLSSAYEKMQALATPESDSLRLRREQNQMDRVVYDSLSQEANRYAALEPVPATQNAITKMHTDQQRMRTVLDDYLVYRDEFGRRTFFARSNQLVKDDIEYLFALARKKAGEEKQVQKGLEILQQQQDIDADIDRLKKELEELEKNAGESGGEE